MGGTSCASWMAFRDLWIQRSYDFFNVLYNLGARPFRDLWIRRSYDK